MSELWRMVVSAASPDYARAAEAQAARNRKLTALLKERGEVSYNRSGPASVWKVKIMTRDAGAEGLNVNDFKEP